MQSDQVGHGVQMLEEFIDIYFCLYLIFYYIRYSSSINPIELVSKKSNLLVLSCGTMDLFIFELITILMICLLNLMICQDIG